MSMDKKIAGAFLVTLLALIFALGLNYYLSHGQNPSPSPSPSPKPTPTPSPLPTPTPTAQFTPIPGTPANLSCNITRLEFITDGGLRLLIYGKIFNTGAQTAYNVGLHIETWFSNGTKGIDNVVMLNARDPTLWFEPFLRLDIPGGGTFTLRSRYYEALEYNVPGQFWLDEWGEVFPNDLISAYKITPIWDNQPPT